MVFVQFWSTLVCDFLVANVPLAVKFIASKQCWVGVECLAGADKHKKDMVV
jgi:hypothetical protein